MDVGLVALRHATILKSPDKTYLRVCQGNVKSGNAHTWADERESLGKRSIAWGVNECKKGTDRTPDALHTNKIRIGNPITGWSKTHRCGHIAHPNSWFSLRSSATIWLVNRWQLETNSVSPKYWKDSGFDGKYELTRLTTAYICSKIASLRLWGINTIALLRLFRTLRWFPC